MRFTLLSSIGPAMLRVALLLLVLMTLGRYPSATGAEIVRRDPRFDRLVPHDARLEKIADGFGWV